VLDRVRALLGSEIATVLHHPLDVAARVVELETGRYQLDLEMREGSDAGARRIEAATCPELAQAAALVLALTIDPELLERTHAGAITESPATAAPGASASATPLPAPPPPRSRRSRGVIEPGGMETRESERPEARRSPRIFRFGPGLRLVGDAGSGPGIGAGGELGVHADWRALRLEFDGVWLPARRASSAVDSSVGGSIRLLALGARVCGLAVRETMAGGLCAAMEFGRLHAEAFGADANRSGEVSWISPGLGLFGRLKLAPEFGLLARLEGLVPLDRSEFIVENVGEVHRPSPLVGRLAVGVDIDF
jgi:hypothetical protein